MAHIEIRGSSAEINSILQHLRTLMDIESISPQSVEEVACVSVTARFKPVFTQVQTDFLAVLIDFLNEVEFTFPDFWEYGPADHDMARCIVGRQLDRQASAAGFSDFPAWSEEDIITRHDYEDQQSAAWQEIKQWGIAASEALPRMRFLAEERYDAQFSLLLHWLEKKKRAARQ